MSHLSFAGLDKTINIVWPLEAVCMWAAVAGVSSGSSINREGPCILWCWCVQFCLELLCLQNKPYRGFYVETNTKASAFTLFVFFFCFVYFYLFIVKFLLLFNYSCLHFLPIPPPHPSQPHLSPRPLPSLLILSMCPCVLYSSSCKPLSSLSPPHSPLAIVRLFLTSVSLVIFCLLISFVDYALCFTAHFSRCCIVWEFPLL